MSNRMKECDVTGRENIKLLKRVKCDGIGIGLDHLLLYTLGVMEKKAISLSFPNISIAICRLFPDQFSLYGWSGTTDSRRVHNCLWHLVDAHKKWLIGKDQFSFTKRGRIELEKIEQLIF